MSEWSLNSPAAPAAPPPLPPAPGAGADSGRSGQPCPCCPPAMGHLYGPALRCINLGCGAPYGTVTTPCPSPRNVYGAAQLKPRGATP